MTAPISPRLVTAGLFELIAKQRAQREAEAETKAREWMAKAVADGDWETYRQLFPTDHPYRHELESPAHENACAHMMPGCPTCPPAETTTEVTA
jgi:hypothetical protein